MNRRYGKGFIFIALMLIPGYLFSQSSQWRGEKRTGHYPSGTLLDSWPENGPEMLLKNDQIGKGYSTPVMEDDIIYITGKIDTMDHITALNLSGEILWQVPYGRSWKKSFPESRSTPTIDGNNIYIISGQGELACLNKKNGAIKWKQYVMKDYEGVYGSWGIAESPLVGDDHVYFTAQKLPWLLITKKVVNLRGQQRVGMTPVLMPRPFSLTITTKKWWLQLQPIIYLAWI